jgi:hypothetical protein
MARVATMSTVKVYALGGLDKKSNDLTRAIEKASEMLNLEYDTASTIKKRNGFAEVLIDGSSTATFNDLIYYNSKDEMLGFTNGSSSVKIIKNGVTLTSKTLSLPSGIPALANVSISFCESQNNLYFTNTDYTTYVMKYDGSNVYRSGLPTPRVGSATKVDLYPSWTNPSLGFTRLFYSFKDINGNMIYSPYYQNATATTGSSVLSINSLKNDPNCIENGFLDKFCYVVKTGSAPISAASRTLTVTRHNYVAGEKFLIDTENKMISIVPIGKNFIVLDVESVTPTSITFTALSLSTYSFTLGDATIYGYPSEYPVDIRTKVHIYQSSSADVSYVNLQNFVIDNGVVINSIAFTRIEAVLSLSALNPVSFEDVYDSAYLKIMPPICKYIASYGEQIVYGSIQSYFTGYTNLLNAPNQKIDFANTSLITYSDTSTGDGPEGTSDFNFTKIGETWDGDITGMRRCNDALIISKTRGIFSIDGTLIDGQFTLRKINSNFVGCTSHKSMLDTDEGVYFQGHNGLYFTNGINITKLSYEIDSVFLSGTYLNTRSVRLKKKQKSFFYVPDILSGTYKIVIVDYYYNQIYMWDSATLPSSGIIEDKNGDVFFCNGLKMFKFNDLYTDNGTAITSIYSTTWHHAGEPSLNKKWLSMRMFGLTDAAFTATITTQGDWSTTNLTTNSLVFNSTDQTKFVMFDMKTKRSFRVTFTNAVNAENMVITGYELTYEAFNVVDKN